MVWQVIIDEVVPKEGFIIVRVTLTDGTQKIRPDEYKVRSEAELKNRLNEEIDRLTTGGTDFVKIPKGPYDPSPPSPTPDEDARNIYAFMIDRAKKYGRAIETGAVDVNFQDFKDTASYIVTNFKPEYIDLF